MESGTHDQEERARAQTIAEASDRSSIKISDLLAKFEPLPKESETVRTRAESFSLEQNKSKRRSINLSAWKEEISIKALSEKFAVLVLNPTIAQNEIANKMLFCFLEFGRGSEGRG